jgi:hypothetical protein
MFGTPKNTGLRIRICNADPDPYFHFIVDPDTTFYLNADPVPTPR